MKSLSPRFFWFLTLSVFWFILIIYLLIFFESTSSVPSITHLDKIIHFFLFFIQSILIGVTLFEYYKRLNKTVITFTLLSIFLFGSIIEMQQIILPHRNFQISDLLFNIFGALSGFFCCLFIRK